nr:hypothetical protein LTR18_011125 [Exophiala xenobiotica]
MRGGEPMALGVNEILPMAPFLHAREPDDVKADLVDVMSTVILVDSVVNSGQTVVDFILHLMSLNAAIRIIIVAGVNRNINLITLRFSNNKFTGRGATDTGNRLNHTEALK